MWVVPLKTQWPRAALPPPTLPSCELSGSPVLRSERCLKRLGLCSQGSPLSQSVYMHILIGLLPFSHQGSVWRPCPCSALICWRHNRIIDSSMPASAPLGGAVLPFCGCHATPPVDPLRERCETPAAGRWIAVMFRACCSCCCWRRAPVCSLASQPLDYKGAAAVHAGVMHFGIPVVRGSKRITDHLSANFPLCRLLL